MTGSAAARVTAALGDTILSSGQAREAVALLEPASAVFDDLGPSERALVRLRGQLARGYMMAEMWQAAVDTADRVLASAERLDAVDIVADVLITRGSALCQLGQPYSGLGAIQAGHDLALTHQLEGSVLRALNNLTAFGGLADPRQALGMALSGLAHARRAGERSMAAYLASNAIEVATDVGEWDLARREMEMVLSDPSLDAEDRIITMGAIIPFRAFTGTSVEQCLADIDGLDRSVVTDWQGCRAAVLLVRGDLEAARLDHLAAAAASGINAPDSYIQAGRLAIRVHRGEAVRDAIDALDGTGLRGRAIPAYMAELAAGAAALEGDLVEARAGFDDALRRYREMDLPWQIAQAALGVASVMDINDPQVRAIAVEGRDIMVRLGATPFVAAMDELLATAATEIPASAPVHPSVVSAADRSGGGAA